MQYPKSVIFTLGLLMAGGVEAGPLAKAIDGEYLTMVGKVKDVTADSFKLDVGKKSILVEMDDYDWDADGYKLVNGDEVVVTGRADKGFLEQNKIEAGSVYVKNIDTYFFANSSDEEGDMTYLPATYSYVPALPEDAYVSIQGKVKNIDGRDIKVDTGLREIEVDTSKLRYNPLDDMGFTQIDEGDRVRVSGTIEESFWGNKSVDAKYVTEL